MCGRPPLGYEVRDRKPGIVEAEAETVRHIFTRHAELGSVLDLRDELAAAGITAERHVSVAGNVTGGGALGRGALYHLLQNRLHRGEIDHKGTIHPGEHETIVDEALWGRVQAVLGENRVERAVRSDAAEGEAITLSVPAMLKRVGMEVRHLIEAPQSRDARKPDRSLVRLLTRALRFRDLLLRGDGKSIAELSEQTGVTRPYFSRIVRPGFLAPDITAAILDGRQPIELSATQLSITAALPKD